MRSLKILCSLILALLGWTAPGHAAVETTVTPQPRVFTAKEPSALQRAEVRWQVIAVRRKGVDLCPKVSGWDSGGTWLAQTLASMLPGKKAGDVRRAIAADPLLKELDRYCSYRKTSGSTPDFPMHPPPAGLEIATKGHMALAPSGPSVSAGDVLAEHFVAQASGGYSPGPLPIQDHHPVRLVFIDTQADGEDVPHASGPSKHGYTLVHLAKQLICPDVESCPSLVQLATRLALPYSVFDPDQPSTPSPGGGNLGLVDDLAGAIAREVFSWRLSGTKEHLILNLSLGWDGELLGELDKHRVSQLPLDAQLVYQALQYARRSEALVIAAAGNRRGGGESNWPLLPAAWELHRPSWWPFALGPKPVYAVGGVDWQGLPLSNYRYGGLPRRVAFGDHAMAQTTDQATGMYTGSSVSTAVVSSIAALVWQLRPDLRPAEVMRLITESGDVLPGRGDYYAWKNVWPLSRLVQAPHLRRLSLCRAVTRACLTGGEQCSIPSCVSWNAKSGAADLAALVLSTDMAPAPDLKTATLPAACRSASHPTPQLFAVDDLSVPDPCPLYLLPDMVSQRWVAPQPDDPPCPSCSLIPPGATNMVASLAPPDIPGPPEGYFLMVDIDAKWLGSKYSIDGAALDVDRYSSDGKFVERTTYAIPKGDLMNAARGSHRLLLKDLGSLVGCTATLNFQVTVTDPNGVARTLSVQSPVYVDPKRSL